MDGHAFGVSFAGVSFCLRSDCIDWGVSVPDSFCPFMEKNETLRWSVDFHPVDTLPAVAGQQLFFDAERMCYKISDDRLVVTFFEQTEKNRVYAETVMDIAARKSEVIYLQSAEKLFWNAQKAMQHGQWERMLLEDGRLILHATLIRSVYGGILFSGVSGIGKSTQAKLWEEYGPAEVLNGDRPVIYNNNGTWCGSGSPFSGSSGIYRNESCPIRAIVLLEKAETCSIHKLSVADAFRGVFAGITVSSGDRVAMEHACALVQQLVEAVPVYRMDCTPDVVAVELLKKTLEGAD